MAARIYTPEIKAAALADLAAGEQPAIVAERYHVPSATVRKWKERLVTDRVTDHVTPIVTGEVTPVRRPSFEHYQTEIQELVIRNLIAKLKATEAIALHACTPVWLNTQSAPDLAELLESLDRSAVAILDRLAGRGADQTAD